MFTVITKNHRIRCLAFTNTPKHLLHLSLVDISVDAANEIFSNVEEIQSITIAFLDDTRVQFQGFTRLIFVADQIESIGVGLNAE